MEGHYFRYEWSEHSPWLIFQCHSLTQNIHIVRVINFDNFKYTSLLKNSTVISTRVLLRSLLEWNQAKLSEGYHFDSEFWILAHFYLKGIYLFVALACSLLQKRLKNKWDILFWDNVRSLLSAQLALQQTDLLSAVQLPSQLFFDRFLQQKQACCCVNTTETNKILRPVEQFFRKNLLSSHCSVCFDFCEIRIGP